MDFIESILNEFKLNGGLDERVSEEVKLLWDEYKLLESEEGCSIISAEIGYLGSLVIRRVLSFEDGVQLFKYERGGYDYVHIMADSTTRILWTDYSDTEPYNRQCGLYCDGSSFESLGDPVLEKNTYREFIATDERKSNTCFGVWGYLFNDFYGSIRFGICLKTDKVGEFVEKLRKIIGK